MKGFFALVLMGVGAVATWLVFSALLGVDDGGPTPFEDRAAALGVELKTECYRALFGTRCSFQDPPLNADQLAAAVAMLGPCEVAELQKLNAAGEPVTVASTMDVEETCRRNAEADAKIRQRADTVSTQREILGKPAEGPQ